MLSPCSETSSVFKDREASDELSDKACGLRNDVTRMCDAEEGGEKRRKSSSPIYLLVIVSPRQSLSSTHDALDRLFHFPFQY